MRAKYSLNLALKEKKIVKNETHSKKKKKKHCNALQYTATHYI